MRGTVLLLFYQLGTVQAGKMLSQRKIYCGGDSLRRDYTQGFGSGFLKWVRIRMQLSKPGRIQIQLSKFAVNIEV